MLFTLPLSLTIEVKKNADTKNKKVKKLDFYEKTPLKNVQ